jgi:RNA polymerase sigma-70 factor, ECF subfamily
MEERHNELTDQEIVDLVKRGDTECFSILVDRHNRGIFFLGLKFFHNREDAKDYTQDVFTKAFRNIGSFKKKSRFFTWLTKIAYNYGIDKAAGGKRDIETAEYTEDERNYSFNNQTADLPESREVNRELKNCLHAALKKLPKKYSLCIDFSFFFDFSYREISEITGIPVNTIKSNIRRGKRILRDSLEERGWRY